MITIPSDASYAIQSAFRDVNDDIRDLRAKISALASAPTPTNADLVDLRKELNKAVKLPTYRSWSEVFGSYKNPSRVVATFSNTNGNSLTAATVLIEYAAPAGELLTKGSCYICEFWGKTANNANAKTLRARAYDGVNSNLLISGVPTASEAGHWVMRFVIERANATTGRTFAEIICGPTNGPGTFTATNILQPPLTFANTITIRITGNGTANNDITVEGGTITLVTADRVLTFLKRDVFLTSGTWTKLANASYLKAYVIGGGGNGGAGESVVGPSSRGGGGGGGGGYSYNEFLASLAGATEVVTVGAVSGTSSLGALLSATGGSTGTAGPSGGAGGAAGVGSTNNGGTGGNGGVTPTNGGSPPHGGAGGGGGGGSTTLPGGVGGTGPTTIDTTPVAGTSGPTGVVGGTGGNALITADGGGGGGGGGALGNSASNAGAGGPSGTFGAGGGGGGAKFNGGAGTNGAGGAGSVGVVVVEQWSDLET